MAVVRGADVSAYQQVAYATAAKAIGFLIVKCTEGAHTTSSAWRTHWTGARGAGLLRGSYHLCHPSQSSATAEADHYVAVLKSSGFTSGLDLPPVLDIEPGHGLGKAALTTWARTFLTRVDAGLGLTSPWLRTGVYVGDSIASTVDVAAIVSGRWFWRGGYGNTWPNSVPAGCSIFQRVMPVTAVPGITGSALDIDVARPEDLTRMAPAYYATQNPVEEDMAVTAADRTAIAREVLTLDGIIRIQSGSDPTTTDNTWTLSTHVTNLRAQLNKLQDAAAGAAKELDALKATQATQSSQLAGLVAAVQALSGDLSTAVAAAVRQSLETGVVDVAVTVHDKTV